jgi:hypothetical protein
MSETVMSQEPTYILRKGTGTNTSFDDNENLIDSGNSENDDDDIKDKKYSNKDSWCKAPVIINKILSILKFIAMGQHSTKFYRNKNSKYSSIFGGLLSLVLYIAMLFLILYSLWDLYANKTYIMT